MRQGQEDDVGRRQQVRVRRVEDAVGQRPKVRMQPADRLAGVAAGRDRPDGELRMAEQQTQQLTAGVPARAGHSGRQSHVV